MTSREYLRRALEKSGCQVAAADGVANAQGLCLQHGFAWFDTVLTDYRMPEKTGLDLLAWLRTQDACLSSIILTAEGEKNLVTQSLRAGALDFLEKPISLQKLLPAIKKAVENTQRLRHMAETEHAVKNLGRTQKGLINKKAIPTPDGGLATVEVCFHPKLEAGGDFFTHFAPEPGKLCCLLTDVSGHDLQAAYISAYFQGVVRGMSQCTAPAHEIFGFFNRFLIDEWSQLGHFRQQMENSETSMAALSFQIDFAHQTAHILTCGTPGPYYIGPDGRAQILGQTGGAPLGWFSDLDFTGTTHALEKPAQVMLWTDGLEDLADNLELHPLAIAFILDEAQRQERKPDLIKQANDDILLTTLTWQTAEPAVIYHPVLVAEYPGNDLENIDGHAERWRRHLLAIRPDLSEGSQHDILLAVREAVLNGMLHGCSGREDKNVRLQFSFSPEKSALRIWVEDPGPGHTFDFKAYSAQAAEHLLTEHRGLVFMMNLAHELTLERQGATVILTFLI